MLPVHWLACEGSVELHTVNELRDQYSNVFKTGNRNAASHLWTTFILERASTMSAEQVETLFHGFCAISGSPLPDVANTEFKVTLPRVGGGNVTGVTRHCCWPCICDETELVKVDTKEILTTDGPKRFNFLVIGDPCLHEEQLETPYTDPFTGGQSSLAQDAPELSCRNGKLSNAIFSEHGYPIIGMLFDAQAGAWPQKAMLESMGQQLQTDMISQDATWGFGNMCTERRQHGYNSGMGKIFHKVAMISPIPSGSVMVQKFEAESVAKSDSSFFALNCIVGMFLVITGVACIWYFKVRSGVRKSDSHMSDTEANVAE
jgi:hypothetical protein